MSINKPTLKFLSLIPVVIGVIWVVYSLQLLNQGILWDLSIYEKAALIFNAGGNPYDPNRYISTFSDGNGHLFVYQPLILRGMALFGHQLGVIMILVYGGSLLFFFQTLGNHRNWWLASFFAFAYCGLGTVSIGSGNVTVFLHLILISLLVRNINGEKITFISFITAVTLFSIVKPYLIVYLLIPLVTTLQSKLKMNIWLLTLAAGLIFVSTIIGSWLYFGEEFQAFMTAVRMQTIGKHDLGHSIVMYFYEHYRSAGPLIYRAYLLHFAILGSLIVAVLFFAKRSNLLNQPNFALLLYFLLTILNPRLKVYDLFPALVALFLFSSTLPQTIISSCLFAIAYTLSLSQLVDTPLFAHTGLLSDPINVYYLTMGIVFLGALPKLLQEPGQPFKN